MWKQFPSSVQKKFTKHTSLSEGEPTTKSGRWRPGQVQIHREVKWSSAAKKEEESQGLGRQVPWAKLPRVSCSGGCSLHFRAKGHLGVSPTHYFSVPLSSAQSCPLLHSGT